MGCMLNFRKRNPRKQNETENFSIIRMDGGTLSRKFVGLRYMNKTWEMVGIFCRPSLFSLVCSFEFHVTSSSVEAVRDTPFLGFKLL